MSTLNITFDKSKMALTNVDINIGFVGTGSLADSTGKVLKTVGEDLKKGSKGNWYTYDQLKDGVSTTGFSGRVYVCYGTPWTSTGPGSEPSFLPETGANSELLFDKIELTFDGSPYSCADLTSIDFWAIPMNLISLKSGTQVNELKGVKDGSSIEDIKTALKKLSNPVQSSSTATELYNAAVAAGLNPPTLTPKSAEMRYNEEFLRIVGPNSYPSFGDPAEKKMMGLPFTPYNTMEAYLQHLIDEYGPKTKKDAKLKGLGAGVIAIVAGYFGGNPSAPQTNLTKAQDYSFSVTLDDDMNLELSGSGTLSGAATLKISKWNLLTPSAMYGGSPEFDLNGTTQSPGNDIYGWVFGDLFAGFNTGAIGSPQKVNGKVVGEMQSSDWFSKLDSSQMFGNLWPDNPNFYNQWAAELVTRSDAYNFAYSERFSAPQLNLAPGSVDTLEIQFLGAIAVDS